MGIGNSGAAVQVATYGVVVTANTANVAINASNITIAGIGFDPNSANDTVSFNLSAVGSVTSATATSLVVTFSTDPTAYGNLTAIVSTTTNGSSSSTQVATIPTPPPTVTPNSTTLASGASTVTIAGTYFSTTASNDSVSFNDGAVGMVSSATATSLIVSFSTEPTASGTLTAVVTVSGQSSGAAVEVANIPGPPPPSISGMDPTSGASGGGTYVTIIGNGFTGATAVDFGPGNPSPSFTVNSSTSITAVDPAGTDPVGTNFVNVTVTGPNGTSTITSADQFNYITGPAITGLSTNSGSPAGGAGLFIYGQGFARGGGCRLWQYARRHHIFH